MDETKFASHKLQQTNLFVARMSDKDGNET
jgi:hypothetical protein